MAGMLSDVQAVVDRLATLIELAGLGILLIGIVGAVARFTWQSFRSEQAVVADFMELRTSLGFHILLALEILICADIMHTVIRRSLDDLIALSAVVLIRTVISYFLNRELREARELAPGGALVRTEAER